MFKPEKTTWIRTRKGRPCPICEHVGWCSVSADGTVVRCMRTVSATPSPGKDGAVGYIHRLTDDPRLRRQSGPLGAPSNGLPPPPPPSIDWAKMLADYAARTDPDDVRQHAADLGVTADSLYRLGIVWCGPFKAWGFPMKLARIQCEPVQPVGIRLRNHRGDKWAVTGSTNGLFIPSGAPATGDPLFVTEGPTDTAAMLSLGLYAIGRPSCSACAGELAHLVGQYADALGGQRVVIIGDRDEAKNRPDGSAFYPGQEGAEQLATVLVKAGASSVKIIYPIGAKDARQWVRNGVTAGTIRMLIRQRQVWHPAHGGSE